MADAYQLETTTDRYLLEDGSGVYLLEPTATAGIVGASIIDRSLIVHSAISGAE